MNCKCKMCSASFSSKLALTLYSLFSLCCTNSFAQNCNNRLSIQVIDLHDGTPLENATVQTNGVKGTTDFDGNLIFENLCEDTYVLTISHVDCESLVQTVDIKKDTFRKIRLEHHLNELEEIMIISNNRNNSRTLFENKISKEVLDDYNSRTLGEVLKTVTGVSSLNSGSYLSKPVINGLHSSSVILINNGVRIEDQEWGIEHAPRIDINSIDKISIIKGARALKYAGDAVGGVSIDD